MPSSGSSDRRVRSLDDYAEKPLPSGSVPLLTDHVGKDASLVELPGWSLRRKIQRHPLRVAIALIKYLIIAVCLLLVGTPIVVPSYTRPPPHYRDLESRCQGFLRQPGCANIRNEQVFISVSLYDEGGRLADGYWGESLLELIHLLGNNNVFLSIYENDSGPEGASALESLRKQLRCKHSIVNDPHVSLAKFPTVTLPDDTTRVKRLAYLSEMRNRALRPLDRFDPSVGTVQYDKVLFLNDVVFHPMEAVHLLLSTNLDADGRANYLSACAIDFWNPFKFYDVYVTRDFEGYTAGSAFYPVFSHAGRGVSRAAMLDQTDAVPVRGCWSGMVAMQAEYIQNLNTSLPNPHFQDISSHVIDPENPRNVTAPVRFRYEPEAFFEACECCLFLADVSQVARKSGDEVLGVFMNPYVRVAYTERTLAWLPWVRRWERLFSIPHTISSYFWSMPSPNPHRTVQEGETFNEEVWVGEGNVGYWQLVQRTARNGLFCGARELQVLKLGERDGDINWENIKIPAGQTMHFPT
ncbi:glycosyltransferase family 69 protein [Durotheca rogersii]|uniref:glycosyltransferase family 69 protein n=1 Tax=Durotheca rogersii TaxID=419775 RepID=UPI00221F082B|nr:glycosyltransferase family 69 protein [Durotheca rogersii]KAI5865998.1 glycosyltransferase family 69 protein [Durotheca rogersii]